MASEAEWVEITCPKSGEPMFANTQTGECRWDAPLGATVKARSDNQWWELYDAQSGKNYYHNNTTKQTVWKKPPDGDIISLMRLQPIARRNQQPLTDEVNHEEVLVSTTATLDRRSLNSNPPPISPYAVKPSMNSSIRPNRQGKMPPPVAAKPATLKRRPAPNGEETPPSGNMEGSQQEVKQQQENTDPMGKLSTDHAYKSSNKGRSIEDISNLDSGGSNEMLPDIPAANNSTPPATDRSNISEKLKQSRSYDTRYSSFHDYSAPAKYSDLRNKVSFHDEIPDVPALRRHSAELASSQPKDKKGSKLSVVRSPTSPIGLKKDKEKEKKFAHENFNVPKTFLPIKREGKIANMLSHSKDSIKEPILRTQNKEMKKLSLPNFKTLQEYMGDIKTGKNLNEQERLKRAIELVDRGWKNAPQRDELFMQLIKQTTRNPKPKSLELGWRLMAAYLYYFPPTVRFQSYLEGYLYKNIDLVPEITHYATYCHERLAFMVERGPKMGSEKPTEKTLCHVMQLPLKKSMFAATLGEVMNLQQYSHPNHHLPWVLTLLAEKIVEYGGHTTLGIFRVPGDIDMVTALKASIDSGEYTSSFPTNDPSVCASLFKEWLRELYDPVIPHDQYDTCLRSCENPNYCATIINDQLPNINRLVVTYVIRFLQSFLTEERKTATRMNADNLAMVFAPNLLRYSGTDLKVVMDNAESEMKFVRTLINNLDTSYMDGVV